ncbi:MAG: Holliday junction resolvase RuvX [Granulosicoccaceae bacterium]
MSTKTYLAFDYGTVRIGVAVGNSLTETASPIQTVSNVNGSPDWLAIEQLIKQWQPDELVVGLPLTVEGEDQAITPHVKGFIKALRKRFGLAISEADERFSSIAAQAELAKMRASGQRTKRVSKDDIDSMAATLILQHWFTGN